MSSGYEVGLLGYPGNGELPEIERVRVSNPGRKAGTEERKGIEFENVLKEKEIEISFIDEKIAGKIRDEERISDKEKVQESPIQETDDGYGNGAEVVSIGEGLRTRGLQTQGLQTQANRRKADAETSDLKKVMGLLKDFKRKAGLLYMNGFLLDSRHDAIARIKAENLSAEFRALVKEFYYNIKSFIDEELLAQGKFRTATLGLLTLDKQAIKSKLEDISNLIIELSKKFRLTVDDHEFILRIISALDDTENDLLKGQKNSGFNNNAWILNNKAKDSASKGRKNIKNTKGSPGPVKSENLLKSEFKDAADIARIAPDRMGRSPFRPGTIEFLAMREDQSGTSITGTGTTGTSTTGTSSTVSSLIDMINRIETFNNIVQKMQVMVIQNKSSMTMRLKPEFLGKLKLFLTVQDGIVSGKAFVETPVALELFRSHMSDLREAFERAGLRLQEFEVSMNNGSGDTSWQRNEFELTSSGLSKRAGFAAIESGNLDDFYWDFLMSDEMMTRVNIKV